MSLKPSWRLASGPMTAEGTILTATGPAGSPGWRHADIRAGNPSGAAQVLAFQGHNLLGDALGHVKGFRGLP